MVQRVTYRDLICGAVRGGLLMAVALAGVQQQASNQCPCGSVFTKHLPKIVILYVKFQAS